jgi:hypothetical protein
VSWRARRTLYLVVLGAAALALSLWVYLSNDGALFDVLATIGVISGLAIVVTAIPISEREE